VRGVCDPLCPFSVLAGDGKPLPPKRDRVAQARSQKNFYASVRRSPIE
jgi:hypothetical protein